MEENQTIFWKAFLVHVSGMKFGMEVFWPFDLNLGNPKGQGKVKRPPKIIHTNFHPNTCTRKAFSENSLIFFNSYRNEN